MSELMNERVGEQVNKWVNKLVSGWVNKRLGERERWKMKREAVYEYKHTSTISDTDGRGGHSPALTGITLWLGPVMAPSSSGTSPKPGWKGHSGSTGTLIFFCTLFLSFSPKSVRSSVCQSPCGNPDERALWWETPLLSDPPFCCFFRPFPSYLITVIMKY